MWVFFNNAFLSVVADKNHAGRLLVRSRTSTDLKTVFPEYHPVRTPENDYPWRISVPAEQVAARFATLVNGIQYTNFKDSVDMLLAQDRGNQIQATRSRLCHEIWHVVEKAFRPFRPGRTFP